MFTMRFLCICLVVATVVGYKLGFPSFKKTDTTKSLVKVLSKTLGIAISSASLLGLGDYASADSRLNAPSAAGTRVNSDEQSLLRYGLPIDNKILRDIQASIESAKMNLRTRRPSFARSDLKDFKSKLDKNADLLLKQVPQSKIAAAKASLAKFDDEVKTLEDAITAQEAAGAGSLQERKGTNHYQQH